MTTQSLIDQEGKYLQTENDGLINRDSDPCTEIKLGYLSRYLDIFTKAMRSWEAMHYIDLLSGPGKCRIKRTNRVILGSPLLAITQKYPFAKYFYNDINEENLSVLKTRCATSPYYNRIKFYTGDCNRVVDEIVTRIQSIDRELSVKNRTSINLSFLDPTGLELEWKTIEKLAGIKRMDLIIYYPQMGLERVMPNELFNQSNTIVDTFFGTRNWREIYLSYKKRETLRLHRSLMDFYEDRLKTLLGYLEIKESEPLMRSKRKNAPLYRLIFASKHPLGNKFWAEAIKKDAYGQPKLPI